MDSLPKPANELVEPLEKMQTDRHVREVTALCQRRRDEGRPWAARACPVSIPGPGKVVHFIRHGQAEHNALAAASAAAACGCKRSEPNGRDTPQASCPYNADASFDAPLTPTGREQARDLADTCAGLGVQLVVSSPLRRAAQTALHIFGDFIEEDLLTPVVLHDLLREQYGMHRCDQRRDTATIKAEFGAAVDVEGLALRDEQWTDQRESKDNVADRCEQFACWLMEQHEDNIAVVAHHHTLLVLFNCVIECGDGGGYYEGLLKPFAVGEMRSVRVEIPTPDDQMMDEEFAPVRRKPLTWQQIANWDTVPMEEEWAPPPPAPGWDHIPNMAVEMRQTAPDGHVAGDVVGVANQVEAGEADAHDRKRQRTDAT